MTLSYYSSTGQDPSGYVMQPRPCRQCGQELQGLHEAHRCAGCGLPVGRSVQPGTLRFAPPAWLGTVRSGLLLELWAIIIGITVGIIAGGVVVAVMIGDAQGAGGAPDMDALMANSDAFNIGVPIGVLIVTCILTYGIWLITTPEPEPGASPQIRKYGPMTRGLALTALAVAAVVVGIQVSGLFGEDLVGEALVSAVSQLVTSALFIALVLYLAELAAHIPDPKLASRTRTVAWGGGIAIAFTAVMSVVVVMSMGDPTDPTAFSRGSNIGLLAVSCVNGIAVIFLLVCYIMYLVTLGQLAGRFRQAKEYAVSILQQPLATRPVPAQQIDPASPSAWTGPQGQAPAPGYAPPPPESSNWPHGT